MVSICFRLNTSEINTMMISKCHEKKSESCLVLIWRALYTPTEGPPKYSARRVGRLSLYVLEFFFQYPDQFVILSGAAGAEYRE